MKERKGIFLVISLLMSFAFFPNMILVVQASTPQRLWALIISGSTGAMFSNDTQYMYHVLNTSYTFDGIYYLDVYTDRPGVNASATKANVRAAINTILANWSGENDIIFIFFSSHGGGYHTNDGWESGRIEFGDDEGSEVSETNFRMLSLNCPNSFGASPVDLGPWPLNTLIDYDGDDNIDDRIRDFDHDLFIEVDINDDNSTNPEWEYNYWVDLDGDGNLDDVFLDAFSDDMCDIFIDAEPNWVIDGTDTNNDGLIIGVDLNGDGNRNNWVGIDECMQVQDGLYWDDELASDLNTLSYAKLIFVREGCVEGNLSCFSGGLIDDISAANRIIMTSSNETGYSWAPGGGSYSFWSEAFIDALHGQKTHYNATTNTVVHDEITVDADINKNGHVSMREAWNYSWNHDPARLSGDETPWLDDNGNGLPTFINETDVLDNNDGYIAAQTYLDWLLGDVNEDNVVDGGDVVLDIAAVLATREANGSYCHHPPCVYSHCPHSPLADINDDAIVDGPDVVIIIEHLPSTWGSSGSQGSGAGILSEGPVLAVSPSQTSVYIRDTFTVNVTVDDVTGLRGWELKLYWDPTLINCTGTQVHMPAIWNQGWTVGGPQLVPEEGMYYAAIVPNGDVPAFSTSEPFALITFTFKALQTEGTSVLDLQDTKLFDIYAERISHTATDSQVSVQFHRRYMRSDTHTVNGLAAYKLGTTQSSSSAYVKQTQQDYGLSATWGIKVWKRTTSGTEIPLTSDIVAQVTRTSQGQGLQSATWNCPQTSLNPTDTIVVRVYQKIGNYAWQLAATFTTEQLGATQLNNTQWTVYYYTKLAWIYIPKTEYEATETTFYWGTTTYNTHIKNFEHT